MKELGWTLLAPEAVTFQWEAHWGLGPRLMFAEYKSLADVMESKCPIPTLNFLGRESWPEVPLMHRNCLSACRGHVRPRGRGSVLPRGTCVCAPAPVPHTLAATPACPSACVHPGSLTTSPLHHDPGLVRDRRPRVLPALEMLSVSWGRPDRLQRKLNCP